jgi:hypothetical protein
MSMTVPADAVDPVTGSSSSGKGVWLPCGIHGDSVDPVRTCPSPK